MGRLILFSPIGGTDPIASSTEYDGSMLHICRHYKPDKVYLFLSNEMLARQKNDDRYRLCIEKLGEKLDHKFEVDCIEAEELHEVQDYDEFYKRFKPIVQDIQKDMQDDDRLIVNVASGTPAMKSTLLMLAVMSEGKIIPVQVVTPERTINFHPGKEDDTYNVNYYWEHDRDNDESAENRCKQVDCPSLTAILKKNILVRQVRSYNYASALMLGSEIRDYISDEAYYMLELAVARQQLNLNEVMRISQKFKFDIMPVNESSKSSIFEYALTLYVKMYRREYGDFMRAISPLLTDIFEAILKNNCGIDIHRYCNEYQNGDSRLVVNKLNGTEEGRETLTVLNNCDDFRGDFKDSSLAAGNLKPILVHFLKDESVKTSVTKMRAIESRIRNMAAHQIVSITDDKIKSLTSDALGTPMTIKQIFDEIKKLVVAAKVPIKKADWGSYDIMNNKIEKLLTI